jgi:hypothetical protein
MNYEQKNTSSYQRYEYQEKIILVLIIGSMNKICIQVVLTRVRDNVPRLSIYTLDIYYTLLVTQAIYMVVAWASNYLACTPSCHKTQSISKTVAWASSRLACTPSRLGLYSNLPKGDTLCLKVPSPLCNNYLEASRIKANIVIYNQRLNLGLNCMFKGYVRDILYFLLVFFRFNFFLFFPISFSILISQISSLFTNWYNLHWFQLRNFSRNYIPAQQLLSIFITILRLSIENSLTFKSPTFHPNHIYF